MIWWFWWWKTCLELSIGPKGWWLMIPLFLKLLLFSHQKRRETGNIRTPWFHILVDRESGSYLWICDGIWPALRQFNLIQGDLEHPARFTCLPCRMSMLSYCKWWFVWMLKGTPKSHSCKVLVYVDVCVVDHQFPSKNNHATFGYPPYPRNKMLLGTGASFTGWWFGTWLYFPIYWE